MGKEGRQLASQAARDGEELKLSHTEQREVDRIDDRVREQSQGIRLEVPPVFRIDDK